MDKKIKGIVQHVSDQQVKQHLGELGATCRQLSREITRKALRSNTSVAYENLVNRTASEIDRLVGYYPTFAEGVAWSARNIFEINLIIRHIGRSAENMNRWLGQLLGDEKQILQGFLTLSTASDSPEKQQLQGRLVDLDALSARHNIQPSGPFNIKAIAEQEQLVDEYTGLYKLFSKYVHPSSWLINSSAESVNSKEYMNIFVIYSQISSGDSYTRVNDWLLANADAQT